MALDNATQPPDAECPDGFLTPPEIAGYQRAATIDSFEIPRRIFDHLAECEACRLNWEWVALLDQKLKRHRRQQAETIVRQLRAVDDWAKSSGRPLTDIERVAASKAMSEDLIAPMPAEPNVAQRDWREIIQSCDDARLIENEDERWRIAGGLSKAYKRRLENEHFSLEILGKVLRAETVIVGRGVIPAQSGESPLDVTEVEEMNAIACFAASIPAVTYRQISPHLLERRGDFLIFRAGECLKAQRELDQLENEALLALNPR